jgi:hypothetical protein
MVVLGVERRGEGVTITLLCVVEAGVFTTLSSSPSSSSSSLSF